MIKKLQNRARDLSIALAATLATGLAMAGAPTDPFDTAVATLTTSVEGYGAKLVVFAAVGVLFAVAIKYVKKLPRAS